MMELFIIKHNVTNLFLHKGDNTPNHAWLPTSNSLFYEGFYFHLLVFTSKKDAIMHLKKWHFDKNDFLSEIEFIQLADINDIIEKELLGVN